MGKMSFPTPNELAKRQRVTAKPYAEQILKKFEARLKDEFRPGKKVWIGTTLAELFGATAYADQKTYCDIALMVAVGALRDKGWTVSGPVSSGIEVSGKIDPEDMNDDDEEKEADWYGTLKFMGVKGENAGLMIVKKNPEMDNGFDVVDSQVDKKKAPDYVHILGKKGWVLIGRVNDVSNAEEQAIVLLEGYLNEKTVAKE